MKYIVKYKIKGEEITKEEIYKDKEQVLSIVRQIQRGIIPLNSKIVISNFEDFEDFKIIEQNYDQKDSNGKCINIEIDTDGDPDITNCYNPIIKNITGDLFDEVKVEPHGKGIFYLDSKNIIILGIAFPLKENTKTRDIFEILNIKQNNGNNELISFISMEEIYNKSKFKNLSKKDFNYTQMHNLLKYKLSTFRNEFKRDIIKINTKGIKVYI